MKLPSSHYRGVFRQQSSKWGAQIYKNNERIWLGTFCTEVEAASTYDLAALCLHGSLAITNFNTFLVLDKNTEAELQFLKSRPATEIMSMLRRHTYHEELKRSQQTHESQNMQCNVTGEMISGENETRQLLFVKLVTASDIGPQSRLLIPRQHLQKYNPFSRCFSAGRRGQIIHFEDVTGALWSFRYVYWSSSGNHVFNGEWAQFAKEKGLKPGNTVQFWRVTTELGNIRHLIEYDMKRTATVLSPEVKLPVVPTPKIVRLFGVNVSI